MGAQVIPFVNPASIAGLAPVRWAGWQETARHTWIDLWNLYAEIPEHPDGSTVSGRTLRRLGYKLPSPPVAAPGPVESNPTSGGGRHKRRRCAVGTEARGLVHPNPPAKWKPGTYVEAQYSTPSAMAMIRRWLDQSDGDVERVARYMRDILRIGGIKSCRALIRGALEAGSGEGAPNPRGAGRTGGGGGTATITRVFPYGWDRINARERKLCDVVMGARKADNYRLDRVDRRSDLEFDLTLSGVYTLGRGGFSGWLPLMAIYSLLRWTSPEIARMTDHAQMVRDGDWSGVRDSDEGKIWHIFRTKIVQPAFPYARNPDEDPTWDQGEEEEDRPDDEDYAMTDARAGVAVSVVGGSFLGTFDSRRLAERFIRRRMAVEGFFPSVWWVSDHGNWSRVKFRGPTKRMIQESGPKPTKANPPRRRGETIYPSGVLKGTWYGRHRNGEKYKHRFGRGQKWIRGLPDGTLQIGAHRGRLWGYY